MARCRWLLPICFPWLLSLFGHLAPPSSPFLGQEVHRLAGTWGDSFALCSADATLACVWRISGDLAHLRQPTVRPDGVTSGQGWLTSGKCTYKHGTHRFATETITRDLELLADHISPTWPRGILSSAYNYTHVELPACNYAYILTYFSFFRALAFLLSGPNLLCPILTLLYQYIYALLGQLSFLW